MIEQYKISDVVADETHPAHEATKTFLADLEAGKINLCGCLGPMYGEPYCPCAMKRNGMEDVMRNNPARIKAEEASQKQWDEFIAKGGFSQYESE